jgi:hypothetical protein
MQTRLLAAFLVAVTACGGDDVNHLADAPPAPDAPPDSPGAVSLTVTNAGSGSGTVTSSPAGITCTSGVCSHGFDPDTVVTLTAVADTGSVFVSWGGACSGTMPTCDVTLAQAASVTAIFDVAQYAVTVTKGGNGMGTVAGDGINCGGTCTVMVDHGTMISLTQTPGALSVFAGWGGACSGNAGCTVTVTGPTTISANFALDNLTLFVTKGGNGAGTVTSAPAGINCGADCDQTYTANQMVTLTAAASTGSTFTGWSGGGCTGTGTCVVTMTAATTVTATFTLQTFTLMVTKPGNGAGNVTSTPAGIACGVDCMQSYNYNTMVSLTATPSTGSTFTGWGGACTGTGACTVTMTAARNVTATFTLMQFTLTVTKTDDGAAGSTVSGNGINCGGTCTAQVNYGTVVTLTPTPGATNATLSDFTGWGGTCSGTGACTFTMTAANTVTAGFKLRPNIMFTTSRNYTGSLAGLLGADRECQNSASAAGLAGTYRAYLGSNGSGDAADRIEPARGWVRTDMRPMFNRIRDFGTIPLPYPPSLDEAGNDLSGSGQVRVWTATNADTSYYGQNCNNAGQAADWSTTTGRTMSGALTQTSGECLNGGSVIPCATPVRLYCFGVDRTATIP